MKSNDKNILEEIDYIITSKDLALQEKNIFIDGSWGIGKTYFFNNSLKILFEKNDYEIIYISLFGKNDINSIKSAFLTKLIWMMFNDKSTSIKNLIKNIPKKVCAYFKNSPDKFFNNFSKLKDSLFKMDLYAILDIYGDNLDNFLSKKCVVCFDDCERVASQGLLPEFLGFLDLLKRNKKIFLLSIGNMAKISDKLFLAYKEKSFTRFFTLYKDSEDVLKIILEKYKYSRCFEDNYRRILTRIFDYKDRYLEKLSVEDKKIYEESKDIFTNIRILEKISDGIKRLENLLEKYDSFNLYEYAFEYYVKSFFFFGLLRFSSQEMKDFSFYKNISAYYDWGVSSTKFAKFEQIVCARVGDTFLQMESAYLYFKEGYLNEQYTLTEAKNYQPSKIFQNFPDIFSSDFWVNAFYLSKDEILSKRKYIIDFINNYTDKIYKEDIKILLRTITQLEVLSGDDQESSEILKQMIDNLEYLDEDSLPDIRETKENTDCKFINQYYIKLHHYYDVLEHYAIQKIQQKKYELLDNAIRDKDFKTIETTLRYMSEINEEIYKKITVIMIEALGSSVTNNLLSIFKDLCKHKEIQKLFLEYITEMKNSAQDQIKQDLYEWLEYCYKN